MITGRLGIAVALAAMCLSRSASAQVRTLTPVERAGIAALDSIVREIVRDSGHVSARVRTRIDTLATRNSAIFERRRIATIRQAINRQRIWHPPEPRLDSVRVSLGPVIARQPTGPLHACGAHGVPLPDEETISGKAASLVSQQADTACTAIQAIASAMAPGRAQTDGISFAAAQNEVVALRLPLVGPALDATVRCPDSASVGAAPVVVSAIAATKMRHRITDLCTAGVELGRRQYDTLDMTVRVTGFVSSPADTTVEQNDNSLIILAAVAEYLAWRADSSSTLEPPPPVRAALQIGSETAGLTVHAPIAERLSLLAGGASLRGRRQAAIWKLGAALSLPWIEPFMTAGVRSGPTAGVIEAGAMLRCSWYALRPGASWTSLGGTALIVALPLNTSALREGGFHGCAH